MLFGWRWTRLIALDGETDQRSGIKSGNMERPFVYAGGSQFLKVERLLSVPVSKTQFRPLFIGSVPGFQFLRGAGQAEKWVVAMSGCFALSGFPLAGSRLQGA